MSRTPKMLATAASTARTSSATHAAKVSRGSSNSSKITAYIPAAM